MDTTGLNFKTQMKQKAEPANIAEEFIKVKYFSDEQRSEQSRNNPKIRTMQPFTVRSPVTSKSK